jgi:hypothetical protein
MPKLAARIWLQIVDVRVERLQAISNRDAQAEGIERINGEWKNYRTDIPTLPATWQNPYHSFQSLWESINGGESWEAHPYVWVIEFKVLSVTGKPKWI